MDASLLHCTQKTTNKPTVNHKKHVAKQLCLGKAMKTTAAQCGNFVCELEINASIIASEAQGRGMYHGLLFTYGKQYKQHYFELLEVFQSAAMEIDK